MQVNLRNIKRIQIIDSNKKEYTNYSSYQEHTVNNCGRQSPVWHPNNPYALSFLCCPCSSERPVAMAMAKDVTSMIRLPKIATSFL